MTSGGTQSLVVVLHPPRPSHATPFTAALGDALEEQGRQLARLDWTDPLVTDPEAQAASLATRLVALATQHQLEVVVDATLADPPHVPAPIDLLDEAAWAEAAEAPIALGAGLLARTGALLASAGTTVVVLVPSAPLVGVAGLVAWSTAAEARRSLVRSAARTFGPRGLRIHSLVVDSALLAGAPPDDPSHSRPGLPPAAAREAPSARAVADTALWLADPRSRALNGLSVAADGGRWLAP